MENVTFVYPGKMWIGTDSSPIPPVSILPLGGILEKNGFSPRLVDMRLEDYTKINIHNQICIGISAMTGSQIKYGLEVAKFVREKDKDIPIIWGGIHPSLLPEQTLKNPYVDIVVRGEGDITCLELVKSLEKGKDLRAVKGITFKDKSDSKKIIKTPNRGFMNLDDTVDYPYHLLNKVKEYHLERTFYLPDSRGCPHRCMYCYNTAFCGSTWRTKSTKKILEELDRIMEKYHPKSIDWLEDNFFPNKTRVEDICKGVIDRGYDIGLYADCRVDYFKRFDNDFMKLITKAGFKALNLGAESGSQRILDFVKKDITVEQTLAAIKKCADHNICNLLFWVIGIPTETEEEMMKTLNTVDKARKLNPNSSSIVTLYSPYPGTPLFDYVTERFKSNVPQDLGGWGNWMVSTAENAFWLDYKYAKKLEHIAIASRLISHDPKFSGVGLKRFMMEVGKTPFSTLSKLRWKKRYFENAYEMDVWRVIQKQRGYF